MSTTAQVPDQIEGLPPGAILRALPQQAIEGLPPGAVLKPIGKATTATTTPATTTPPPEGFWHSLGTQLQGMLDPRSLFDPMHLPSPQQAAGMANDFVNAATQSQHPISPTTGQPIVDPLGHTKTLHMAAALLAPVGGGSLEKGLEQVESGNPKGAAGTAVGVALPFALGGMLKPKVPTPAAEVTPTHVEALTGLIEDRGGTVDPHATATEALPHLRETAVRMGVDPSKLEGRAAGQATLKVAEQAVRGTQNEFNQIRKPYNPVLVDQSSIAKAYRDAITPELLANEPKVARALEKQAAKFDQPAPLEQVNQFRVRMNNQLNAFEQRGTTAQIMSDIESKASHAAANAARDVEYSTVGRLSGLDPEYIRGLKQREGSLIEAKGNLERRYNEASGEQGKAVTRSVIQNPSVTNIKAKVSGTYPSHYGMMKSGIKAAIAPKPIAMFNDAIKQMFSGMGAASDLPEYEQVQPPAAPQPVMEGGTSGPVSGAPEDMVNEVTRRGPGTAPSVEQDTATRQLVADYVKQAKQRTGKAAVTPPTAPAPVPNSVPADIEITPHGIGLQPTWGGGAKVTFSMNFNGDPALLKDPMKLGKQLFPDLADRIDPNQTDLVKKSDLISSMSGGHYGQYRVSVEFKTAADAERAHAQLSGQAAPQLKLPAAPAPVANGQITPEHVAAENAFYTQARAELGANAPASDVLRRAQALKVEHTAAGAGPPVTPVPPTFKTTASIQKPASPTSLANQFGKAGMPPEQYIWSKIKEKGLAIHGSYTGEGLKAHLDLPQDMSLKDMEKAGLIVRNEEGLWEFTPHITGEASRVEPANVSRTVQPTLTQKMQAQPTPTLRRVNPPTRPSPVAEQSPRQQATALMLLVKQGKLTPAEADSRIQKLVGPGGRRLIRRPVAPE